MYEPHRPPLDFPRRIARGLMVLLAASAACCATTRQASVATADDAAGSGNRFDSPEACAIALFDAWRSEDWRSLTSLLPVDEVTYGPDLATRARDGLASWLRRPTLDPRVRQPGDLVAVCTKERKSLPFKDSRVEGAGSAQFEERVVLVFLRGDDFRSFRLDDVMEFPGRGWINVTPGFSDGGLAISGAKNLSKVLAERNCRASTDAERAVFSRQPPQSYAEGIRAICHSIGDSRLDSAQPDAATKLAGWISTNVANRWAVAAFRQMMSRDAAVRGRIWESLLRGVGIGTDDCPLSRWLPR